MKGLAPSYKRRWSSTSLMELSKDGVQQEFTQKVVFPIRNMTKEEFFPVVVAKDEEIDKSK